MRGMRTSNSAVQGVPARAGGSDQLLPAPGGRRRFRDVCADCQLTGARVIDIGGASGYVGDAMVDAGASALTVEYDWDQIVEHGRRLQHGVQGNGLSLPIFDAAFDVAYSSNVLEHVPDAQKMLREMVRVVCPGGVVFVNFTNWLSPWEGTIPPWHYFGGDWAVARYEKRYGEPPKNRFGSACTSCRSAACCGGPRNARTSRFSMRSLATTPTGLLRWCGYRVCAKSRRGT